jgi:hypothetical protein
MTSLTMKLVYVSFAAAIFIFIGLMLLTRTHP